MDRVAQAAAQPEARPAVEDQGVERKAGPPQVAVVGVEVLVLDRERREELDVPGVVQDRYAGAGVQALVRLDRIGLAGGVVDRGDPVAAGVVTGNDDRPDAGRERGRWSERDRGEPGRRAPQNVIPNVTPTPLPLAVEPPDLKSTKVARIPEPFSAAW